MQVQNLQFTHSELMMLEDNSLHPIRTTLQSLSIVNAKLNEVSIKFIVIFVLHSVISLSVMHYVELTGLVLQ